MNTFESCVENKITYIKKESMHDFKKYLRLELFNL